LLEIVKITKDYPIADGAVHALRGVSLNFRKSEFVSILGASGCGKTTLLNIIGGLDRYTSGDIIINGVSTKKYNDRDWDTYRNHSIGFIFQSYNLIPHQTVLSNVELSLTLSGVKKEERRARARKALEEVGLGEQIGKLPKQLSGGQMQRVAIARALVNNPDILLADEPTGALDSETGVQVMELLHKIAQTRLVIMVTHNPELADTYSTRIIRLKDGEVISDSNPYNGDDESETVIATPEVVAEETAAPEAMAEETVVPNEATEDVITPSEDTADAEVAARFSIKHRNIAKSIVFYIITLGIYGIYWQWQAIKAVRALRPSGTSAAAEMLCALFVPFYLPYWWYTRAKIVQQQFSTLGQTANCNSVLMLILSLLGWNIVNLAIMQTDFNEWVFAKGAKIQNISKKEKRKRKKMPSMSFFTALSLSFRNLMTKKRRTAMVSFAGSIGIIGIALILSVSEGTNAYIGHVQESTLSTYPLTLESQTIDMTALMESFMNVGTGELTHDKDGVYKDPIIAEMVEALSKMETGENDLAAFKKYLESELANENSELKKALTGIRYTYNMNLAVYTKNQNGDIIKSDTGELMMEMISKYMLALSTGQSSSSSSSGLASGGSGSSSPMMSSMMGMQMWQELLPGLEKDQPVNDILKDQYDVVKGAWPNEKDEIVLIINENHELDDLTLYALGLMSREEIDAIVDAAASGQVLDDSGKKKWTYDELLGMRFKTIFPYDLYQEDGGIYKDVSNNTSMLELLYKDAFELKVVGIIAPKEDGDARMLSSGIGYTNLLTQHIIKEAENSDVVKAQLANPTVDVLSGLPFKANTGLLTDAEKESAFRAYVAGLSAEDAAAAYVDIQCLKAEALQLAPMVNAMLSQMEAMGKDALIDTISKGVAADSGMSEEKIKEMFSDMTMEELKNLLRPMAEEQMKTAIRTQVEMQLGINAKTGMTPAQVTAFSGALQAEVGSYTTTDCALYYDKVTEFSEYTYDEALVKIGCLDLDKPFSINLYAASFEQKDIIEECIANYNKTVDEASKITYTDYIGLMMSSITTIINAITWVLVAFVAISLIVSSIMIGVITLISVQERTKEIGILRAIGASKRNVSGMFNAETMIIGFVSGVLGVGVTYLLCIPVNIIMRALTEIENLRAFLPWQAAILLVIISVLLTLISGIIPSRSAAKKDPVVALRTE